MSNPFIAVILLILIVFVFHIIIWLVVYFSDKQDHKNNICNLIEILLSKEYQEKKLSGELWGSEDGVPYLEMKKFLEYYLNYEAKDPRSDMKYCAKNSHFPVNTELMIKYLEILKQNGIISGRMMYSPKNGRLFGMELIHNKSMEAAQLKFETFFKSKNITMRNRDFLIHYSK